MFSSYPRDTATQGQVAMSPIQQTTYPINNAHVHGDPSQLTKADEAMEDCIFRLILAGVEPDQLVNPHFRSIFLPSEPHSAGHLQQPPIAGSNSTYVLSFNQPTWSCTHRENEKGNPSDQAVSWDTASVPEPHQPLAFQSHNVPIDLITPMGPVSSDTGGPVSSEAIPLPQLSFDELCAEVERDRIEIDLARREELKKSSNIQLKRPRTAENMGAGPSRWTDLFEDRDEAEPPDTRSTKRRRITTERRTEDRVAAQRGDTQELRARRTLAGTKNESKLGNQGLRRETLVAPSQGVHPPFSPRPTTGTTLGTTEFEDQAWKWREGSERTSEGTEEAHDGETDEGRWTRLMVQDEGRWKCRECPRQQFFDRSTLRRHCKTVHGEGDRWKCPICPDKDYSRKSGLDRHKKEKHQGGI